MSQFLFETIRLENGEFFNLDFHQKRMDESRAACGFLSTKVSLLLSLSKTNVPKTGLWRCRVSYSETIERIEVFEYSILKIKQIALIEAPEIQYDLKWEDRSVFQKLLAANPDFQEIRRFSMPLSEVFWIFFTNELASKGGERYISHTLLDADEGRRG